METVSIFDATAAKRGVKKEQKAWKYIHDLCSLNSSDMSRLAVIDGNKKYTYRRMFREWERYASVFTAMEMTGEENARVGVLGSTCAEVIFAFYGLNMVGVWKHVDWLDCLQRIALCDEMLYVAHLRFRVA